MAKKRKIINEELIAILQEKDIQYNICNALIKKALNGDIKAFEVIRETIGENYKDLDKSQEDITTRIVIVNDLPPDENELLLS